MLLKFSYFKDLLIIELQNAEEVLRKDFYTYSNLFCSKINFTHYSESNESNRCI